MVMVALRQLRHYSALNFAQMSQSRPNLCEAAIQLLVLAELHIAFHWLEKEHLVALFAHSELAFFSLPTLDYGVEAAYCPNNQLHSKQ
jgi:hypothetical protein